MVLFEGFPLSIAEDPLFFNFLIFFSLLVVNVIIYVEECIRLNLVEDSIFALHSLFSVAVDLSVFNLLLIG